MKTLQELERAALARGGVRYIEWAVDRPFRLQHLRLVWAQEIKSSSALRVILQTSAQACEVRDTPGFMPVWSYRGGVVPTSPLELGMVEGVRIYGVDLNEENPMRLDD